MGKLIKNKAMNNSRGFAPIIALMVALGVAFLGFGVYAIKPWNGLNLSFPSSNISSSPAPKQVQYSKKQLEYLKHKDQIMSELKLNEQQFEVLLEASGNE